MEYDNTNKGVIFKNDQKGNEKAPIYKGKINVEGKDYEISLWVRESEKAGKFFSASIQQKQEQQANPISKEVDNDMPF